MSLCNIANVLSCLEKSLIGVMALAAIILVVVETVLRFAAPAHLTDWSGEVTIYLVGWALMLSLPHLVARDKHVRADLLHHQFSPLIRWWLDVFAILIGIGFCGIVLWAGIDVVSFGLMFGEISDSSLQFPMWVFYLAVPVGFGTSMLRYVVLLISKLLELRVSPAAS
ncbi:TRAP transporter small permease [Thalassospira xiamenensis]|nr:TRAP transporter small permease [Thalassospira xiamenensis]